MNSDIITSHRLGLKPIAGERPKLVIVKFATTQVRDVVIRVRCRLRENTNRQPIYINEDLTHHRAVLAKNTQQLKKVKKVNVCWTYNSKVVIKTLDNSIIVVCTDADLHKY